MKRCGKTGKIRYIDAVEAGRALSRLQKEQRELTHMYRCKACRSWHLASVRASIKFTADQLDLLVMALRESKLDGTGQLADYIQGQVRTAPPEAEP